MSKTLSDHQASALVDEYISGVSHTQLMKKYGVSRNTVYRTLSRLGVSPKRNHSEPVSREMLDQMVSEYVNGSTFVQVSRRWGLSRERVVRLLLSEGVESRGNRKYPPLTHTQVSDIIDRWAVREQSKERIAREIGLQPFQVEMCLVDNAFDARMKRYATRENHGSWNHGKSVDKVSGYVSVRMYPGDPLYGMANANGRVLEHRYVMAQSLGRILDAKETVHHKDGNKANNDISNLQLRQGRHGKGASFQCQDCHSRNVVAVEI